MTDLRKSRENAALAWISVSTLIVGALTVALLILGGIVCLLVLLVVDGHRCPPCAAIDRIESLERDLAEARKALAETRALLDSPEVHDFMRGVPLEAAHQRDRWGSEHDDGKSPADWFWLIGYLAGKALRSHIDGDTEKALHHTRNRRSRLGKLAFRHPRQNVNAPWDRQPR